MKIRYGWPAVAVLLCFLIAAFGNTNSKEELARQAVSGNDTISVEAIKSLRAMGKDGLNVLFDSYAAEIKHFSQTGDEDENWRRIARAIDGVAMQKDAYASHLYWYTDLDQAKKAAAAQNKPILSLRLLGNLNEEFSCANSRFFRAVLYPNAEISRYLNDNYVLHWQSVRPAPKVTIDFGDGRKIERTLTGNSIHYVLDTEGTVVDALPGLNSPARFLEFLTMSRSVAKRASTNPVGDLDSDSNYKIYRTRQHRQLTAEIDRIGTQTKLQFDTGKQPARNFEEMPSALVASAMATAKAAAERTVIKSITADVTRYGDDQIKLETWQKIAQLLPVNTKLDENSIAFIKRQTAKNSLTAEQFSDLIGKLEAYIDVDTARNDFLMRPTLCVWLNKDLDKDLPKLNARVYSELFLTPDKDRWLGLYAPGVYTALDGNGIIQ